ncbi:hypothetical protein [Chondrinema litorale]|uniref:hypothetical protein n=1 Tax=Chondrinema litorale TaxID=2994555 RepID=UPI002542C51B|nr:hypothetical protein [Chondrinema litorale]UZR97460.1 hypothetical protein OQ292_27005 [Chondrinema litorale]
MSENRRLILFSRVGEFMCSVEVLSQEENIISGRLIENQMSESILNLFKEYEELVNNVVFSMLDELEDQIDKLGFYAIESDLKYNIHQLQIMNETDIAFKIL